VPPAWLTCILGWTPAASYIAKVEYICSLLVNSSPLRRQQIILARPAGPSCLLLQQAQGMATFQVQHRLHVQRDDDPAILASYSWTY